ncbi:DNA-binding storekeeper protein-related transcriptional regulator [Parasponia andersonii]|uniref:DNA-binding storekeeper protein-related transcriptional regulator n=1 Tax=Parasponia andersonii TaxID=3476 RepID=A0A2P5DKS4_PARAD|nr:DNA-binding storekeeper protein-related transcriptional regulator [Parasponia andersonii]
MASHQDDVVLPGEEEELDSSSQDDDEDDEDDDEEENDDVLADASPSTSSAGADRFRVAVAFAPPSANTVTVALPAVVRNGEPRPSLATAAAAATTTVIAGNDVVSASQEKKPAFDDSRKLFQRLWTDEDEIGLLQGFLDYTTQRGKTTHHGQNDTALFYDQIKSKLQLDFNKNQLVEKLRRLKKKYRNVIGKISSGKDFSFKSPHDQATFEISRKIWSDVGRIGPDDNALEDDDPNPSNPNFNVEVKAEDGAGFVFEKKTPTPRSRKRSRSKPAVGADERRCINDASPSNKENYNNGGVGGANSIVSNSGGNVQGLIEETVKSCLSPLFKELVSSAMAGGGPCAAARGFGGLALSPMPLSFGGPPPSMGFGGGELVDERWRKQQILELEVYSKRLELVQDQIKAALEDLRSRGGGS